MMRMPTRDCECEDFPCCEHADNFPEDDPMTFYCDVCGGDDFYNSHYRTDEHIYMDDTYDLHWGQQ